MKRKKVALVITIAVCAIMCGSNTVTFASGYTEENQDDYSYDEYADSDESDDEVDIPQNSEDVVDDVTFFSDIHKEKKLKKILKKLKKYFMRREPALYRGSDNQRENKNPGFRIRNADCCA